MSFNKSKQELVHSVNSKTWQELVQSDVVSDCETCPLYLICKEESDDIHEQAFWFQEYTTEVWELVRNCWVRPTHSWHREYSLYKNHPYKLFT